MISKKCSYALKAMLSLARHYGEGPITIQQIAGEQDIPARFLEAILRDLKQNGFTESIRGKEGGYILTRPARDIGLGTVIRSLEGPWFAGDGAGDVFSVVWDQAEQTLSELMDSYNFQLLLQREDEIQRAKIPDYSI